MQLCRVLGQPPTARLLVSKEVLDDVKRMLNLCSNTGFELLEMIVQPSGFRLGQRTELTGAEPNMPPHRAVLILFSLRNTLVARIADGLAFIAMQQSVGMSYGRLEKPLIMLDFGTILAF